MKHLYYLLFCLFSFVSCHSTSDSEKATDYLHRARHCVAETYYNQAKVLLDSIHQCYPLEVDVRRLAKILLDSISVIENDRTLAFCDSLLPLKEAEIASTLKHFRREEDSSYIGEVRYVHRLLRTENNSLRCYLQAKIGESGSIFLKSTYCGRPIKHNSVELYSNDFSLKASGSNFHSFQLDNVRCETLLFSEEEALNLLRFLEEHKQESIKVVLAGESSSYPYFLMESERNALADTYALSVLLSDCERLRQERRRANIRKNQSLKRLSSAQGSSPK